MDEINYQLDRIRVNVQGNNGRYYLSGNYEIDGNGTLSTVNVSAFIERESVPIQVGIISNYPGGCNYIVTEFAEKEGISDQVIAAMRACYNGIGAEAERMFKAVTPVSIAPEGTIEK